MTSTGFLSLKQKLNINPLDVDFDIIFQKKITELIFNQKRDTMRSGPLKKTKFSSLLFLILASFFILALSAQQISHDVSVINIEVPVKVFKGDKFVDGLTIADFEVYEDGKLQKIEAVYLIKKTKIEKEEGKRRFSPRTSRNYVLVFEIQEYLPEIEKVLAYFFNEVFLKGDTLIVVTPVKTYHFKSEAFQILPLQKISDQLKEKLRKDIIIGNSEYNRLMKDIEELFSFDVEADIKKLMYMDLARKLKNLKQLDQKKMLEFADFLKKAEGQKHVFIFYQKELVPILPELEDSSLDSSSIDTSSLLLELSKEISFDIEKTKQAFSDSSITVNSLFISKIGMFKDLDVRRMQPMRVKMFDQSNEIFNAFREVAFASGGLAGSSSNAAASFQKAVDASENYYLLYYSPQSYKADGNFRNIKVKVKNANYRITHRAGYFAN